MVAALLLFAASVRCAAQTNVTRVVVDKTGKPIKAIAGKRFRIDHGKFTPKTSIPLIVDGRKIFIAVPGGPPATKPGEAAPPSPGLYSVMPYSCLVVVPENIDPSFAVVPPTGPMLDNCIVSQPIHFEPKK